VPQGSVAGPFFFLVFINDLASSLGDIFTKIFADDTTMLFAASTVEGCVDAAKIGVRRLMEWCEHNQLFVNWSKTYFMFVTNKPGVKLPTEIPIDGIKIQVVNSFRLLGVTLDTKLDFVEHASNIAKSATNKLFAIKRISHLAKEVKIQFLKTFILPFFDFGLTLIIYYSQTAINKITKAFYNAIFHILRIDCSRIQTVEAIDDVLRPFNLSSFQQRTFIKLATFGFQMKFAPKAPAQLKAELAAKQSASRYELRESSTEYVTSKGPATMSKSLGRCFQNFYANMLNKNDSLRRIFCNNDPVNVPELCYRNARVQFIRSLNANVKTCLKGHLVIFPRFTTNFNLDRTRFILKIQPVAPKFSTKCPRCFRTFNTARIDLRHANPCAKQHLDIFQQHLPFPL
jgi:hypothetical protein